MEAKHTPTPWRVDPSDPQDVQTSNGLVEVACTCPMFVDTAPDSDDEMDANAAFIVRACNSHDALVEALKWYVQNDDTNDEPGNEHWLAGKAAASEALALAGETP